MINGTDAMVTVPHPMTEDHFIVGLYLTDQDGNMIDKVQLTSDAEASHTFALTEDVTSVTPWALCDDHDLWVGDTISREVADKINGWESTGVLTPNDPGEWGSKIAGHYPIAIANENTISVVVPHPMTEDHWIAGIYLKDATGHLVGFQELTPSDLAQASFDVADGSAEYTAYAFCNLHEVWSAPLVRTGDRPGPWPDKVNSHTPTITIDGDSATVVTPHPMSEEHYIVSLYITDQEGNMISKVQLNPTDNPEATHTFELPSEVTSVTPWSLCDDHDLWMGATAARA
jgi:superoxide reductase